MSSQVTSGTAQRRVRNSSSCRWASLCLLLSWQTVSLLGQDPAGEAQGFWARHGDKILVAIVILILSEPIKKLFKMLWTQVDRALQAFGWRFRKRYLEALADDHRWLKLIGFYHRAELHPPRLTEVYISLRLAAAKAGDSPRLAWNELFDQKDARLVILGPPGSGKSTLIDYLVLVFTGHVRHPLHDRMGKPLPLFGRLRKLGTAGGPDSLVDLLRASTSLTRLPAEFPVRQLRRGGCVVLLDGLDEVLDVHRHDRAVDEIRRLIHDYPDNAYVVTCRVAGWRHQLPGFRTFEIEELSDDDVRQFIGAWYREVLRSQKVNLLDARPAAEKVKEAESRAFVEAGERAALLWQALVDNEGLLRIARTPLILSLITLVHYHRVTDLPRGRARLYEECLNILLELWDRQDKRLQVGGASLNEKLLVLRSVAFHYLREDLLEAGLPELEEVVAPLLAKLKDEVTAAQLVENVWQRSGILVEQALGRYGFAHRALQDYLAAAHVKEYVLEDLLLQHAAEERWREVILITIGLVPDERASRLLASFLEREGEDGSALEVAGLSLAEDVQVGEDLRAKVRRRLLARLEREESPGAFGRLTGALLAADVEQAREWMGEVLRGRDPQLRDRVLELLPSLGEEHGASLVPLLLRLFGNTEESSRVRVVSASALLELGVEADAELWEILARVRREQDVDVKAAATRAWCELGRWEELGLVEVPAGEFLMGAEDGDHDEKPQHALYLPTFYVGRHPVTVGRFREFVSESGFQPEDEKSLAGEEDHPVVLVSWHEALEYARWYGFSLPSEAEWEKAARGTAGRRYPWGNEWTDGLANTGEFRQRERQRRLLFFRRRKAGSSTTAVGRFSPAGDSPYGCADMAGNVWEWTRSSFNKYPYNRDDGREDLSSDDIRRRVLRGGSFANGRRSVRVACRSRDGPRLRVDLVGFRVAVSPFRSGL